MEQIDARFWLQFFTTIISAIVMIFSIGVGWASLRNKIDLVNASVADLAAKFKHHVANDDQNFAYVRQRLDKFADDKK